MIDVLSTLQSVLRGAGFITRLVSIKHSSIVCFEDDVVTGFACIFEDPASLLTEWKATELSLLTHYAPSLRAAAEKAWNVYCVFLCASPADADQSRQVRWIEEDLNRTRKLAVCGLASRDDVTLALLPVLPLQSRPLLRAEDVTERLRTRIMTIAPKASSLVLDESVSQTEVVRILGEPS